MSLSDESSAGLQQSRQQEYIAAVAVAAAAGTVEPVAAAPEPAGNDEEARVDSCWRLPSCLRGGATLLIRFLVLGVQCVNSWWNSGP